MDTFTMVVAGLVVLPSVGLLLVVLEALDAYADLVYVRTWGSRLNIEQANHDFWSQITRSLALFLVVTLATAALIDVLNKWVIAALIYGFTGVLVWDAFRGRRARKRMVALVDEELEAELGDGQGED